MTEIDDTETIIRDKQKVKLLCKNSGNGINNFWHLIILKTELKVLAKTLPGCLIALEQTCAMKYKMLKKSLHLMR